MRCNHCPALVREGYEYPEEYCCIYPEDEIIDFSDGSCGCKHPLNAIKRRLQQNETAREKEFDGIVEWYQEQEDKEKDFLEALRLSLQKLDCVISCKGLDGEYKPIDRSLAGEDTSMRCDSLTSRVVFEMIDMLYEKGYEIKRKEEAT